MNLATMLVSTYFVLFNTIILLFSYTKIRIFKIENMKTNALSKHKMLNIIGVRGFI